MVNNGFWPIDKTVMATMFQEDSIGKLSPLTIKNLRGPTAHLFESRFAERSVILHIYVSSYHFRPKMIVIGQAVVHAFRLRLNDPTHAHNPRLVLDHEMLFNVSKIGYCVI